ncbi:MAG: hypothetical protein ABIQ18_38825 [Umezawaea sp.]
MNGRPLHEQLVRGRSIARDLVAKFVAEIPLYQALPREELDGDITRITATNLRIVERMLRTGVPPTEADLADLAVSAARRAAEGVPLGAVLTAYSLGIRAMWHVLLDDAGPDDLADVLSATDLVLRFQQTATSVVATAYAEERQTIFGHERDARHALVTALLAGDPVADRVADRYAVVVLDLGRCPEEGTDAAIAARRALLRVQDELRAAPAGRPRRRRAASRRPAGAGAGGPPRSRGGRRRHGRLRRHRHRGPAARPPPDPRRARHRAPPRPPTRRLPAGGRAAGVPARPGHPRHHRTGRTAGPVGGQPPNAQRWGLCMCPTPRVEHSSTPCRTFAHPECNVQAPPRARDGVRTRISGCPTEGHAMSE